MLVRLCLIFAALSTLVLSTPALADSPNSLGRYLRYTPSQPAKVETSLITMQTPTGSTLDLISAVHLGEPSYYRALNQRFRTYDAVLYELVLPETMAGSPLPAHLETGSGISGLQSILARGMGLTTQLSSINYSARNFVHADLTQEALSQAMSSRQESLLTYVSRVLASSGQGGSSTLGISDRELAELDLMGILSGRSTPKEQKILRKLMASTMTGSSGFLSAMEDTAILGKRNEAALKVLDRQLRAGRRHLAIFYGAAHMPDLERQLQKKGWVATHTDWVKAWSI